MEWIDIFLIRGLERVLIVAFGGFSIFLGYKLFLTLPEKSNSEGKLDLPGGISIYLTRIGPGVLFAAFGAAILIYSMITQVKMLPNSSSDITISNASSTSDNISISSFGGTSHNQYASSKILSTEQFTILRTDLRRLDMVLEKNDLSPKTEIAWNNVRLNLIRGVWNEKRWGSFKKFKHWYDMGRRGKVSAAWAEPAALLTILP